MFATPSFCIDKYIFTNISTGYRYRGGRWGKVTESHISRVNRLCSIPGTQPDTTLDSIEGSSVYYPALTQEQVEAIQQADRWV